MDRRQLLSVCPEVPLGAEGRPNCAQTRPWGCMALLTPRRYSLALGMWVPPSTHKVSGTGPTRQAFSSAALGRCWGLVIALQALGHTCRTWSTECPHMAPGREPGTAAQPVPPRLRHCTLT